MAGVWLAIAKAEFLVRTARLYPHRKLLYPLVILGGLAWALIGVPAMLDFLMGRAGDSFEYLLATSLQGVMRIALLFLWLFIMIVPISNSLENLKTDQWEIIFSSNVSTRDLLLGTFIGKIPVYGIFVIFMSPVLVTPFAMAFNISVLGQLLMYGLLFVFTITSIWISNVLATALQAKIGESPRGDDIGKALSWALMPIVFIPAMSMFYWTGAVASLMGADASMILPSSWVADILALTAVHNSDLPLSSINIIQQYMIPTSPILLLGLLIAFIAVVFIVGAKSADTLFALGTGPLTRKVARAGPENIFIRGLRRIGGKNFGVIMATVMKDYTRKLQNVAKLSYGMFLALMVPLLIGFSPFGNQVPDPLFIPVMTALCIGMMLGLLSGVIFGGVGLLDSRDQLWILKGSPSGVNRYMLARISSYMLLGLPYAIIPSVFAGLLLGLPWADILLTTIFVYCVVLGGIGVGLGVTAANPTYEDASSGAFVVNQLVTVVTLMAALIVGLIQGIIIAIHHGVYANAMIIASIPPPLVGLVILIFGIYKLNVGEVA